MKEGTSFVAVLATLLVFLTSSTNNALVHAALFPDRTPVLQISNPGHFRREILDIEKPTIVAFTAPWCGHCQRLAPQFHGAASKLDGVVKFANVDCEVETNKATCSKYGVRGFPTIKVFPSTKRRLPRDYERERSEKELITFAEGLLPAGARKLQAAELQVWVDKDADRPKVILFSTKPVASPTYRSLALDFRSSVDFAHMRGDEQVVRSSARLSLGLDMATEKDLPVLVIIPARENGKELEKSKFETYSGKLKYWPVKKWLDDVAPKMGAKVMSEKEAAAQRKKEQQQKKKPTVKSKVNKAKLQQAAKKEKAAEGDDDKENIVPEGGFMEWKATKNSGAGKQRAFAASRAEADTDDDGDDVQMETEAHVRISEEGKEQGQKADTKSEAETDTDEPLIDTDEPMQESFRGKMLDIERAGQLADELRAQRKKLQDEAIKEGKKQARKPRKKPTKLDASSSSSEDGDKSGEGTIIDKAKKVLDDAGELASDTLGKLFDSDADPNEDGSAPSPFKAKSRALMAQFERWMAGEDVEWSEENADVFEQAQKEAEALLQSDPEKAREMAWQSEQWLLEELEGDRKRMGGVMSARQKKQVDDMIDLVKGRLEDKGKGKDVFERTEAANPSDLEDEPDAGLLGSAFKEAGNAEASKKKARHEEL